MVLNGPLARAYGYIGDIRDLLEQAVWRAYTRVLCQPSPDREHDPPIPLRLTALNATDVQGSARLARRTATHMTSVDRLPTVLQPGVAVVIVNYRTPDDTLQCCMSLGECGYSELSIIVVDNGSGDDSVSRLRSALPDIHLVDLPKNLGFAGGCNIGMVTALDLGVEFIWLLNPDTYVVPSAVTALVETAHGHADAAFIGSWIAMAHEPDRLWFGGGRYNRRTGLVRNEGWNEPVSSWRGAHRTRSTSWITGCSVFVRASCARDVGLLDESYFLYVEEVEWQLRTCTQPIILGEVLVYHSDGKSTGGTRGMLGTSYMARNHMKLALAHAGSFLPVWLGRWVMHFILRPATRGRWDLVWAALLGVRYIRAPGEALLERLGRRGRSEPEGL